MMVLDLASKGNKYMGQKITPWTTAVQEIMQKAVNKSRQYFQSSCGTPHLFLGLFSFLDVASRGDSPDGKRYKKIKDTMKKLLNDGNVDGVLFKEKFFNKFPMGEEPGEDDTIECKIDREFTRLSENLKARALSEERSMEVEDFIAELFSDNSYAVFEILEDCTGSEQKTREMTDKIVVTFKNVRSKVSEDLEKMEELLNINEYVTQHPQKIIGGENALEQIEMALSGRSVKSAVLVGKAGTGKTSYIYDFAQHLNSGEVPPHLQGKIIYQLDPNSLIAGTRFRGDFEEKLKNIIETVKNSPNVILFIDEFHTIVKLGDGTDGANNASNILKPYITRGEIQILGATTEDEYAKHILPEKAFARRFHKINISEPTDAETLKILEGISPVETEFFGKSSSEELREKIVTLSNKYTLDQANPAKAINMLELAYSYSKIKSTDSTDLSIDDIIKSIGLKYDIFISKDKYNDTKTELNTVLLGQEKALDKVCNLLSAVNVGLVEPKKPLASMILAGPTGVGKTETARIIAKNFFGNENNLIKMNMGEYSDRSSVTKLIGSDPGYIGSDEESELVSGVKQHPSSVILFDEIEKAHPDVLKILLSILDEGEMTDNHKNHVSFRNTIIIFTTNLGYGEEKICTDSMGDVDDRDTDELPDAIKKWFSTESLGRIDTIVSYSNLTAEIGKTLIERYRILFNDISKLDITFNDEDVDSIIEMSNIEKFGAREIKKNVKRKMLEKFTINSNKPEKELIGKGE